MARDRMMPAGAARSVIVCAEDYGVTEGASHAVLDLVGMQRVSAVAATAIGPVWRRFAQPLAELRDEVAIGLHLVPAGSAASHFDHAPLPAAVADIERQIASFCDATGFAPDFVGSAGHAHVRPVHRRALFLALERAGLEGRVWLRDPTSSPLAIMRRGRARMQALSANVFALGFAGEARRRGYAVNRGFSGFVAGPADFPVERDFQRYLQHLGPAHLVACRPAYLDDDVARLDLGAERRMRELMYLSSTRFTDLLEVLGLRLARGPAQSATGIGAPMTSSSGPTRQE